LRHNSLLRSYVRANSLAELAQCLSIKRLRRGSVANTVNSQVERLKVFISYARADAETLAEELVTGLNLVPRLGWESVSRRSSGRHAQTLALAADRTPAAKSDRLEIGN
jgi:hypothetical protein